jgi:hypothetical protein
MQRVVPALFSSFCLGGCVARAPARQATVSSVQAAAPGIDVAVPGAQNALDGEVEGAPVISVVGDDVRVDGERVGDVRVIESSGRMQRIDGLFDAMKARREAWKQAHPGEPFPGVAERMTIESDGSVPPAKVEDAGSTITDHDVVLCVLRAFADLKFPAPGHKVQVVYPIAFKPSD